MLNITNQQIKTTMRYHLPPVKMAVLKNIRDAGEDVEKRRPICTERECKLAQPLETSVEFPQKVKTRTTTPSSNSIPEYLSEDICMPIHVDYSVIYNKRNMETAKCLLIGK